ncbi:Rop family plasmid primer RNA-binding protein [Escherichia coli]|nr:Rop family plasmid primer RNA-binding protein [Escherichia coli]
MTKQEKTALNMARFIKRGRLRKRKIKHAKPVAEAVAA